MGRTEALLAAGLLALAGLAVGCNGKTSSVAATEDSDGHRALVHRARGDRDGLCACDRRGREDRPGRSDAAGRVRTYPVAEAERGRLRPPFRPRRIPDRRDRERCVAGGHRVERRAERQLRRRRGPPPLYVQGAGRRARDGARRRRRRQRRSRLPSSRRSSRAANRSAIRSSSRSRRASGSSTRSTPSARSTSSTSLKKKTCFQGLA